MISKLFPRWKFEEVFYGPNDSIIRAYRRDYIFYVREFSESTLEDAIRQAKYHDACIIESDARKKATPKNRIVGVL